MKQIRIGVAGVCGRGFLAAEWHKPDGKSVVVAGMDVSAENLEKFKAEVSPDAFTTQDYRELLDRDDVDAIAVMGPDYTHEEYAVAALKAGKHVFCEKPLAITTEGCDRILEEWHRSGKHLMAGHNMRYGPIYRVMKDIIDSGTIGDIKAVWVRHFVGYGGNFYYHGWHANHKNSTGLLLQKACHDIDMIHWLTGHYSAKVSAFGSLDYYGGDKPNDLRCTECADSENCVEMQASHFHGRYDHCAFRQEVDVEDNNVVIMELDNGIKASYLQCHFTPDYHRNYTFIGTEGRLENFEEEQVVKVRLRDRSNRWKNLADQVYHVKHVEGGHDGADPALCKDFIDMLVSGKDPDASPIGARMSVATGCAATESLRDGGGVKLVPGLPPTLAGLK